MTFLINCSGPMKHGFISVIPVIHILNADVISGSVGKLFIIKALQHFLFEHSPSKIR